MEAIEIEHWTRNHKSRNNKCGFYSGKVTTKEKMVN
jgi:hypothetical protein